MQDHAQDHAPGHAHDHAVGVGSTLGERYVLVARRPQAADDEWDAVDTRLHRPVIVAWAAARSGSTVGPGSSEVGDATQPLPVLEADGRVVLDGGVHQGRAFLVLELTHDPGFDDTIVAGVGTAFASEVRRPPAAETTEPVTTVARAVDAPADPTVPLPLPDREADGPTGPATRPVTGSTAPVATAAPATATGRRRLPLAARVLLGAGLAALVVVGVLLLGRRPADQVVPDAVTPGAGSAPATPAPTTVAPATTPTAPVSRPPTTRATTAPPTTAATTSTVEPPPSTAAPTTEPPGPVTLPPTTTPPTTRAPAPVTTVAPTTITPTIPAPSVAPSP